MAGLKTYTIDMSATSTSSDTSMDVTFRGKIDRTDPASILFEGSMSISSMTIQVIQTKTDAYMNMGGTWTKVTEEAKPDLSEITQADNIVSALRSGIKTVKYVGEEAAGSETLRQFELTITDAGTSPGGILSGGTVSVNIWLDANNFQRKADIKATQDANNPTSILVTMNDINVPVTITAPI